jgi:hypothetical protein
MRVMNSVEEPFLIERQTGSLLYRTLARPMYATEGAGTRGKQDINRITACEMKFTRRTTAGYTEWDHKT